MNKTHLKNNTLISECMGIVVLPYVFEKVPWEALSD
jgi:hypothetical protein